MSFREKRGETLMGQGLLRLFFIRHGQSIWNQEGRIQGQRDVPLSEIGRQQAVTLGRRLKSLPFTACFTSPLQRAKETAERMRETMGVPLPILIVPELKERSFGRWEGLTPEEVRHQFPETFQRYWESNGDFAPPEGESLSALVERVRKGMGKILGMVPQGNVLIVTHASPLRVALCLLLGLPPISYRHFHLSNASITIVEFIDGKAHLVLFNDTCHSVQIKEEEG